MVKLNCECYNRDTKQKLDLEAYGSQRRRQLTWVGTGAELQEVDNVLSEGNQLHRMTAGGDKISLALGPHPAECALSHPCSWSVNTMAGKASALANKG